MRCVLLIAVMAAWAIVLPRTPLHAESVTFPSGSYADFRQVFAKEAPTATVTTAATLTFPTEARDCSPAVVIVHTISGYQDSNEGRYAAEVRKAGFATLTYESPAARSMLQGSFAASRSGPPWASAVAEAYGALRLLASNPRIDAHRIAIVGFSFGGEVAHLAAVERLRSALAPGDLRFAAHVAYYPAGVYGIAADQAYAGVPVLMLLGEKDDNLPIAKAEGYFAYSKAVARPSPFDVRIYPGAYHAWTVPNLGAPRFYPQYPSARKCPHFLLGADRPALLVDGQARPMDLNLVQTCLKEGQGYSMAYDEQVRAESTRDALAFLRANVRP